VVNLVVKINFIYPINKVYVPFKSSIGYKSIRIQRIGRKYDLVSVEFFYFIKCLEGKIDKVSKSSKED
jgi:hypothetical protein